MLPSFAHFTLNTFAEEEKEVYTRPLPLTSCQEDRLGLDYTVLCLADLVYQFGRMILEGMFRENLLLLPLWIRPPGFLVRGWSKELNGSAR